MRDESDFPQRALTREVIAAFYEVYNHFRGGYLEAVYAGALAIELRDRGIAFRREARLEVRYKGQLAGNYRADFLIEQQLVIELKACVAVGELDRKQLLNYLRITRMPLGLVLHFGPEAHVLRVINSSPD